MRKIGILTFHKSLNYGAVMQCYSLFQRISSDFPQDHVEIIDYTAERIQRKYSYRLWTYAFSSLPERKRFGTIFACKATAKNILNVCKKRNFLKKRKIMREAFNRVIQQLALSSDSICTDDCAKATEWLQNRYDILVVGSDCVWEINNYPFPNIYFLHDIKNVRKLSYAACAQGVLYKSLNDFQRRYMAESWEDFEYLGIRDEATEDLLKAVDSSLELHHNCDPTVFLQMDKIPVDMQKLKRKFENVGVDFSKPVICLMGNESTGKICREVLGNRYQIVAVYEENKYADCFLYDLEPFEWAKCFSLFSLTFTNRFHGTLLSMKNGVSPVTFDFAATSFDYSNNGNTKIRDLYERLGMTDEHYFVGKQNYSQTEVEVIIKTVEHLLFNDKKAIIEKNLLREEQAYYDFSAKLST